MWTALSTRTDVAGKEKEWIRTSAAEWRKKASDGSKKVAAQRSAGASVLVCRLDGPNGITKTAAAAAAAAAAAELQRSPPEQQPVTTNADLMLSLGGNTCVDGVSTV